MSETTAVDGLPGAAAPQAAPVRDEVPRFTQGSILRHIAVMSATGGIGLMAIFVVDLLSLLYVSWLHDPTKVAGVGFASAILFFAMSFNIGLMIAISALVAKDLGARNVVGARRMAASGLVYGVLTSALVSIVLFAFRDRALALLNAQADAAAIASSYLAVTLPANIFMGLGMVFSAILRAKGDARRAMYVTLGGGIATAFLDPLLIFGLQLDVMGAAYATVISRFIFTAIGYYGAVVVHQLVARPRWSDFRRDAMPLTMIAMPAIVTNLATPVGGAFLARVMADFGNPAVAATAVIDRLTPLAFGGLFALSGAVGPVLGQNWGAGLFTRMKSGLWNTMLLSTGYVLIMWIVLVLAREEIVNIFALHDTGADLVRLFCWISGPAWMCIGALFVANASFNNLGFPLLATFFNWGRVLVGTIPFALLGAHYAGAPGAMVASLAGGAIFGIGAVIVAWRTMDQIAATGKKPPVGRGRPA